MSKMKQVSRNLKIGVGLFNSSWPTLILLLGVLGPSTCVLWFMIRAVQNEGLAVRQKLLDSYRGHLALAQERLDTHWRRTLVEAEASGSPLAPAALFARQGRSGMADAVICFDTASNVVYPSSIFSAGTEAPDARWQIIGPGGTPELGGTNSARGILAEAEGPPELEARGLLSQARSLAQSGRKAEAIALLTGPLAREAYRNAKDAQGRQLVPNAELMALELVREVSPAIATPLLERLKARLNDYGEAGLSSVQRRFLMHEVQRLYPAVQFPTLAAEELAARLLEAGPVRPGPAAFQSTVAPGIWQLTSVSGRVAMFYWTESLIARMRPLVATAALPSDVRVDLLVPDQEAEGSLTSLAMGALLPGWRLSLSLKDRQLFDATTRQRITAEIWVGALIVATMGILALGALRLVRRQMALTQIKNDLVANVTHELKTPLSSMRLLVDTLLNSERLHEKTAREYLQLIAKENERLTRLIDNFLTFSRIERNKYAFDFKTVAPDRIIAGASAAVRERFQAPACRFEVEVAPGLPAVVADADAMVTAVLNLLENAYKYSAESKQIKLSAGPAGDSVVFAVQDNGVGIPPREAERIFQRFYQVDRRLCRTGGGCGLGLSIVNFIVAAHHGHVAVQSRREGGSVFTITLPAAGGGGQPGIGGA